MPVLVFQNSLRWDFLAILATSGPGIMPPLRSREQLGYTVLNLYGDKPNYPKLEPIDGSKE